MKADSYLEKWPLGSYIFDTMQFTVEKVAGHLVGGWLVGKNKYTDPEDNPWVALVTVPVVPGKLLPYGQREEKYREHDTDRLVAGEIPEEYAIHVVSGSGRLSVVPVHRLKAIRHGLYLLVVSWQPGNGYIIVQEDPGDSEVGILGGAVAHTSSGWLQVQGYPEFASASMFGGATKEQHLFDVAYWLGYHLEEVDDA